MTRDELRALADELESNLYHPHKRAAAVLRQIADAKPGHWTVEVRWADLRRGGDWKRYSEHWTAWDAQETADRAAGPGDIEARVVPLYRLPLEG